MSNSCADNLHVFLTCGILLSKAVFANPFVVQQSKIKFDWQDKFQTPIQVIFYKSYWSMQRTLTLNI